MSDYMSRIRREERLKEERYRSVTLKAIDLFMQDEISQSNFDRVVRTLKDLEQEGVITVNEVKK